MARGYRVTRRDGTLSNVHPLRPMQARQLCEVIAPIVAGLDPARLYPDGGAPSPQPRGVPPIDPATLRRIIPDERPDLFEMLRKAGARRSWRDEMGDFFDEVRASPAGYVAAFLAGFFGALALVVAPFALGWLQ